MMKRNEGKLDTSGTSLNAPKFALYGSQKEMRESQEG